VPHFVAAFALAASLQASSWCVMHPLSQLNYSTHSLDVCA